MQRSDHSSGCGGGLAFLCFAFREDRLQLPERPLDLAPEDVGVAAEGDRRGVVGVKMEIASGLSWYPRDGGIVEVEIRGGREDSGRIEPDRGLDWDRPFSFFELARRLDLGPDEWIGRQHFRSSGEPIRFDPVVDTLANLAKRASEFNQAQAGPLMVPLEERALSTLLRAALARRLRDGRAFCHLPIDAEFSAPTPWSVHLAVINNEDPTFGPRGTEVVRAGDPGCGWS